MFAVGEEGESFGCCGRAPHAFQSALEADSSPSPIWQVKSSSVSLSCSRLSHCTAISTCADLGMYPFQASLSLKETSEEEEEEEEGAGSSVSRLDLAQRRRREETDAADDACDT